ncbi:MAG: recombinase family protein, partial [Thermodesulfobacteriota bacterium]|nr:recombinase family protein [Thermodesulfobacteriota bacterium]
MDTNTYTAIYVRVSTEEQAQKGYSTKNQIDQLTNTAKKQGWKYRIFDDMGHSGAKYDRPGLTTMFDLIRKGKVNRVLVWKIDRLSRKLSHLLNILELLESNKVELISNSENFNINTPMGKLLLGLLGSVAEFERDSIIQRIKAVKNTRKRVKRLPLGHIPYGLKLNEEKNRLVFDDGPSHEIVKKIFDLSLHGIGMVGIAEYLNNNGFRTKYNKRFDSSTIGRMLSNHTYAGMIEIDGKLEHGSIDPIVTFDTYRKIRQEIQKRTSKPSTPATKHLLTGLLKCNVCGSSLVSTGNYKRGKRFYRCGRSANEGRSACPLKSFHADKIETSVTDRLIETIEKNKAGILEAMINGEDEYRNQEKTATQNIQRLKTLIKKNIKSINEYFEMFESEFMDKAELKDRIEALKA